VQLLISIRRESLQISAAILAQNLKSVTSHLATHSALLSHTVAYPSTNFPGRTQENLLTQLLRKKVEPGVEAWAEEGRALGSSGDSTEAGDDGDDGLEDVWTYAKDIIVGRVVSAARTYRSENYTAEEVAGGIENVNTGLRKVPKLRQKDEDDEDDSGSDYDEDEDEEMDDGDGEEGGKVPGMSSTGTVRTVDEIVRFMAIGVAPEAEQQPQIGGGMRR
jgi:mediator of RNA polymerase II transcription subunit 8, fungi type